MCSPTSRDRTCSAHGGRTVQVKTNPRGFVRPLGRAPRLLGLLWGLAAEKSQCLQSIAWPVAGPQCRQSGSVCDLGHGPVRPPQRELRAGEVCPAEEAVGEALHVARAIHASVAVPAHMQSDQERLGREGRQHCRSRLALGCSQMAVPGRAAERPAVPPTFTPAPSTQCSCGTTVAWLLSPNPRVWLGSGARGPAPAAHARIGRRPRQCRGCCGAAPKRTVPRWRPRRGCGLCD